MCEQSVWFHSYQPTYLGTTGVLLGLPAWQVATRTKGLWVLVKGALGPHPMVQHGGTFLHRLNRLYMHRLHVACSTRMFLHRKSICIPCVTEVVSLERHFCMIQQVVTGYCAIWSDCSTGTVLPSDGATEQGCGDHGCVRIS